MKREIEWHDAATDLPDTDTTVLCGFEDGECEPGYYDSASECWRSASAGRFTEDVEFWAHLPEVPNRKVVAA